MSFRKRRAAASAAPADPHPALPGSRHRGLALAVMPRHRPSAILGKRQLSRLALHPGDTP
jgi:hypothetical protein